MKLLLLLNNDIHSATALKLLSNELKNHQIRVFLSKKVGNSKSSPQELLKLKEIESFEVDEKYQKLSEELNCEIGFIAKINAPDQLSIIKNFAPDLIISIRFGEILQDQLISIPKFGVINLHSGILPNYRGIMSTFWAILNGEIEIGTTLHYIEDAGIDCGKIIKISKIPVNFKTSLMQNIASLYNQGCRDIIEFMQTIKNEKHITLNQKESSQNGAYYSYPNEDDIVNFCKIMRLF